MKRLGGLESEVMDLLWDAEEPQSVRGSGRPLARAAPPKAYTTILTVVTHLHEKGWVQREKTKPRIHLFAIA